MKEYKYIGDFSKLEEFGYKKYNNHYEKQVNKRRIIYIDIDTGYVDDLVLDHTTYTGYAYEGEYNHYIKFHIRDLLEKNLVKEVKNA